MDDSPLIPSQVVAQRRNRFLVRRGWKRLAVALPLAVICTFVVLGILFGIASTRGSSMNPTLGAGDKILFSRRGDYTRGDIVIFRADAAYADDYIKRIVGLPGDTVDMDDAGRVLLNGAVLNEPYARGFTEKKSTLTYPITLQSDEYFVLGDARENSQDSRNFGAVHQSRLVGKLITVLRMK
ncbi:MAG: signal peptidase I [Oscillospiraceae bacterium]|jgi:signal peptidase I|nr:signal peptidase I [Oscillospiraceae bacterium]